MAQNWRSLRPCDESCRTSMEGKMNLSESPSAAVAVERGQLPSVEKCENSTAEQEGSASALRDKRSVRTRLSSIDGIPLEQEIWNTKRGCDSKLGKAHAKSHKRKSPNTRNVTRERVAEEVARVDNGPTVEIGRAYGSKEIDDYRSKKRIKLKSSIISCTDQGPGGDQVGTRNNSDKDALARTELDEGKPSRAARGVRLKGKSLKDEARYKLDSEEQFRGTTDLHHPGSDLDRNKKEAALQSKKGRDEKIRSGLQQSKNGLGGEFSGSVQRPRLDAHQFSRMVRRGRNHNPAFTREDGYRRVALKRARDHESRGFEDSRKRKDADKRGEWATKHRSTENKALATDYHVVITEDGSSFQDRLDRARVVESQGILEDELARQSFREKDRNHDTRIRRGRDLRQKLDYKSRIREHREGINLSKHRAGRNVQLQQLSRGTGGRPQSRNEGSFNGSVGYRGDSVAHIYKQIKRRAAYNSDDGRWRDDNGPKRGVRSLGGGADNGGVGVRDQRRLDKGSVKERLGRWPKGADERSDSFGRNREDQKSGRENADYISKAYEEPEGQRGVKGLKGLSHELGSEIDGPAEFERGLSRRCSSKIVAPSQQDFEDGASDLSNQGIEVRKSFDRKKESRDVQENGSMGIQEQNEKLENEKTVDDTRSVPREESDEGTKVSEQSASKIRKREDAVGRDMSPQVETNLGTAGKLQDYESRKDRKKIATEEGKRHSTDSTKTREKSKVQVSRERKGIVQRATEDYQKRDGSGKQNRHHRDGDSQGRTEKVEGRAVDSRDSKRSRVSRERAERSNESLSRRRDLKSNSGENRDDQKYQRHLSRSSHSASPNKQKGLPSSRDYGKPSSSIRSERDHKEREKLERERNPNPLILDSRYRRFGGGTSGLGGYSPRRRRSEAAIKTPSPPPRSPDRRRQQTWDAIPPGMDSSMIAAISAAHQAAVQHALVTLATTVAPLGPANVMASPGATPTPGSTGLQTVPSVIQSLLPQVNPAVTAVTLTQATRPSRRLYVGNVPATVSDGELLEFMNAAMLSANANHLPGTKPCINCSVNVEKGHAFAEFITPEDATAALAFDGVTLHGTTLKIRRPKDFAFPSNVGIENASGVPDMVSSCVIDSPFKVFVGGIPSSVTADKVKELVTAFGQLKAYHWEIDLSKQPPKAYAFLEYMDPAAMPNACAGLNGMRLGTGFLTVVQATPDADPETACSSEPFYGVPEHAKSLLEPPSRVLELHNLVLAEEVSNLSKEEIEQLIEDVRIECSRFGNVKSTHLVQSYPHTEVKNESGNPGASEDLSVVRIGEVNVDYSSSVQEIEHEEGRRETTTEEEEAPVIQQEEAPVVQQEEKLTNMKGPPGTGKAFSVMKDVRPEGVRFTPDLGYPICSDEKLARGKTHEKLEGYSQEARSSDVEVTDLEKKESNEGGTSTGTDQMKFPTVCDGQDLREVAQPVNHSDGSFAGRELLSGSTPEAVQASTKEWEIAHLGKVYVEFSREEAACQAAHTLHGRTFDGRKVAARYFPLKLYQKKFNKGLIARTFEERQALALAVQGHLTAHIKD